MERPTVLEVVLRAYTCSSKEWRGPGRGSNTIRKAFHERQRWETDQLAINVTMRAWTGAPVEEGQGRIQWCSVGVESVGLVTA
jgi:hypothetical protein